MSQNKTIVPGVDYDNPGSSEYDEAAFSSLYTRSGNDDNRTCIAGAQGQGSQAQSASGAAVADRDTRQITMQNRVIVGCLFSISHGLLGEMFPLYLGRNAIGQAAGCDVCLREKTVSPEHAILYIRKEGNPVRFNMTITDYNSANGTEVNGTDARYNTLTVNENDVISIGRHYKLLVKTFNVEAAGLFEDEGFEETGMAAASAATAADARPEADIQDNFYSPSGSSDDSSRTVISGMF